MRFTLSQTLLAIGVLLVSAACAPNSWAQSTISDRAWEFTSTKGLWGVFLPEYRLGTNPATGPAYHDDLDDVGYIGELKLVRRFLGTRTNVETKGFYAVANSSAESGVTDIDVPHPQTGAINSFALGRPRVESEVDHYGFDLALRDTWRTQLGGLSAGCAFSCMAFDQEFDVDYGATHLMREQLDADFRGGKAIFGWDGCICGRPSNLDLAIGFYDMNADYRFLGQALAGSDSLELSRDTMTVETSFTTRTPWRGHLLGWKVGMTYISDMPIIRHDVLAPVSLETDNAVMLSGLIEILL